ncbi:MAG: PP2C family protein-serine/threonine phosphatase, partial [Oceanidesulfovibrio sp.]
GMFRNGALPRDSEAFLVDPASTESVRSVSVRAFASPHGVAPAALDSTDAVVFQRMVEDLRKDRRGVVRMEHRGRPSLWAYGTIPGRPLAFVLISPLSPYLETLVRTQNAIDSVFEEQIRFMWLVLVALAMLLLLLSSLFSRMFTRPLDDLAAAMNRIANGDYTARVRQSAADWRRKDEIGAMRRTFNAMAVNLEEHEQTKEDLGVARLIQRRLLPETPPSLESWDIAGESLYSKETGGDIYDYILTPPRADGLERITLSVGDATGHGIQAALLMTTARAMLRALLSQGKPLAEAVSDLNWLLTRDTYGTGRFLSLFVVEISARNPVLHWVRCGHEPALLYISEHDAVTHLRGTGAILGVDSSIRYQAEQTTLRPGSTLLLATDGVWETTAPDGTMYGHARLEEMIRNNASKPADRIVAAIIEDLRVFRCKDAPEDDSTIIVAKYQA